ncbi:hypothetical protein C8R47DRAFT_1095535 [Mycena vitilis]|nr:hypothetical protein C8R47DRAFT_1095535 [Mycena vitilis]
MALPRYPLVRHTDATGPNSTQRDTRDDDCSLFDNKEGSGPCVWNPNTTRNTTSCQGSAREQCVCSGVSYLLSAACNACFPPTSNLSWDAYSNDTGCGPLPQQFPPPLPTGFEEFPSWVLAMVSATPTPTSFDLNAASAFAESPNATRSSTSGEPSGSQTAGALSRTGTRTSIAPTSSGAQQSQGSTGRKSWLSTAGPIAIATTAVCLVIIVYVLYRCLRNRRRYRHELKNSRRLEALLDAIPQAVTVQLHNGLQRSNIRRGY